MIQRTGTTVEVEHRVGGSPETVFEYFIDPEKHRRWMGAEAELDARPGGVYRVTFGPQVWVRGEYVTVEPPHRLVLTWGFEGTVPLPQGLQDVPAGSSTVEFSFVPDGDGTIIHVRHTGLPSDAAREEHDLGWKIYPARLAIVLLGDDPGPDPSLARIESEANARAGATSPRTTD